MDTYLEVMEANNGSAPTNLYVASSLVASMNASGAAALLIVHAT